MPRNDRSANINRVKHMIDATKEALFFIRGKSRKDLENDRKLALSLIKEIEIIGEAANKISHNFRDKHKDIPWDDIIATRNRLIHGYFDIDLDIVWSAIQGELPSLLKGLKKII